MWHTVPDTLGDEVIKDNGNDLRCNNTSRTNKAPDDLRDGGSDKKIPYSVYSCWVGQGHATQSDITPNGFVSINIPFLEQLNLLRR